MTIAFRPGPVGERGASGPPGASLSDEVYNKIMADFARVKAEEDRKWEAVERFWRPIRRAIPWLWTFSALLFGAWLLYSCINV